MNRLLERLLYRRPRGGKVHTFDGSAGSERFLLSRGTATITQDALDRYGIDFWKGYFPDTDIVVVERL